jgi:hypothetical protein
MFLLSAWNSSSEHEAVSPSTFPLTKAHLEHLQTEMNLVPMLAELFTMASEQKNNVEKQEWLSVMWTQSKHSNRGNMFVQI